MEIAHPRAMADSPPALNLKSPPPDCSTLSSGINTRPGSEDDGWIAPPPIQLSDGTQLQLYKDGEALHAAYEAIKSASELICLEVYIFANDPTGQAFADLLCEKARQGLSVYVIFDSFGSITFDRNIFRQMRQAGVRLQEFHPVIPWESRYSWRLVNRDHRKLLIIDGRIAGIGGLNIGSEYAGQWIVKSTNSPDPWRDNAVGIVGPAARLFLNAFARSWHYATHGGRIGRAEYSARLEDGQIGVLASVPTLNSPLRPNLCRLMHSARQSIYLTMAYFAPDDTLVDELCGAASRGVRVRLMLPGQCDVALVRITARSYYERLMSCGIEVYERQGAVLHAKSMVVDQTVTVMGSTNLDNRSIQFNCEIAAVIRSAPFGRQMHDLFENDVHYATKMKLPEWRRRPTWDRLVQWAISHGRYWL